MVTGMRFAMAGAWTSIVAAEMLAATSGVGYLISQAGDYLNMGVVFAGIITIAIAGLALDACLRGLLLVVDPSPAPERAAADPGLCVASGFGSAPGDAPVMIV